MRFGDLLREHVGQRRLVRVGDPGVPIPLDLEVVDTTMDRITADDLAIDVADNDRLSDARFAAGWRAVPEGTALMLLVQAQPARLPVGPAVEFVVRAGLHVLQAVPSEERTAGTVLVAQRSAGPELDDESLAALGGQRHLDTRFTIGLDRAGVRRLLAERAIEGLVNRSQAVLAETETEQLRQRVAGAEHDLAEVRKSLASVESELLLERDRRAASEAEAGEDRVALQAARRELAQAQDRVKQLTMSRSFQLGQSLARAKRHPLREAARMPSILRRTKS